MQNNEVCALKSFSIDFQLFATGFCWFFKYLLTGRINLGVICAMMDQISYLRIHLFGIVRSSYLIHKSLP